MARGAAMVQTVYTLEVLHAILWNALASQLGVWCRSQLSILGKRCHKEKKQLEQRQHLRTGDVTGSRRSYRAGTIMLTPDVLDAALALLTNRVDSDCATTDAVIADVKRRVSAMLNVELCDLHLQVLVGPICMHFGSSGAVANTILRSTVIEEVLGATMSGYVRACLHAECWSHRDTPTMTTGIGAQCVQEMVALSQKHSQLKADALRTLETGRQLDANNIGDSHVRHTSQRVRKKAKVERRDELKTATVEFMLNCRIAMTHAPRSLIEADKVLSLIKTGHEAETHAALDRRI